MFTKASVITAYNYESELYHDNIKFVPVLAVLRNWWYITPAFHMEDFKMLASLNTKLKSLYPDREFLLIRRFNKWNIYWRFKHPSHRVEGIN